LDADRVVAAVQRLVLEPGERVADRRDWPGIVTFRSDRFGYEARPADWLVGGAPWVEEAVRVVADGDIDNFVFTYGLLFERGGRTLFLNDVATMRELGRRLGADLDPLAYAQLLAELYSGRASDRPTVLPAATTEAHRAGVLVRDLDELAAQYPWVDTAPLAVPAVQRTDSGVRLEFCSVRYFLTETSGAVDVLQWTVLGGGGQPASWSRRYLAEGLERRLGEVDADRGR
jgi:hypothetical protein